MEFPKPLFSLWWFEKHLQLNIWSSRNQNLSLWEISKTLYPRQKQFGESICGGKAGFCTEVLTTLMRI